MCQALAERLNISLEQSFYILWDEFDLAVNNKKRLLVKIMKRQKSCRLRISTSQTLVLTNNVNEIFSLFEKKYIKFLGKDIKGVVAYNGKVIGRVQIIATNQQVNKFKNNCILVAQMTSPDYIIAIEKAKAIIIDDGGLTCHAAIVARELKKPCIVGTRNATKILNNGDLIEVDANQGEIKILKLAKN